jgi:hypothetical protein
MKRHTALLFTVFVLIGSVLLGVTTETSSHSVAVQNDEDVDPEVKVIPNQRTALQNESTSLAVQIRNRVNRDRFVLVRIFEPHGVSRMRVNGETPTIPHNNTDMWQTTDTLGPRQRIVIPVTIEPGSNPGEHLLRVQVKYFNESGYTDRSETGVLAIGKCSATCRARGAVAVAFDFFVSYRNAIIAILSLSVATLSLLFTIQRTRS